MQEKLEKGVAFFFAKSQQNAMWQFVNSMGLREIRPLGSPIAHWSVFGEKHANTIAIQKRLKFKWL